MKLKNRTDLIFDHHKNQVLLCVNDGKNKFIK